MKKYLGEELLDNLTPDFSTTDYDSDIIFKISIMGAFKKYFEYTKFLIICGNPYIIIEGTAEDYEKIIKKAKKLKKYKFEWYIDRIIPLIEKMVEAKKGNIDVEHFKKIFVEVEIGGYIPGYSLYGWFLNFFAYETDKNKKLIPLKRSFITNKSLPYIANQMLNVPFKIITSWGEEYLMKYKVGFIGCDQNEKGEVFPVKGWIVSENKEEEEEKDVRIYEPFNSFDEMNRKRNNEN